MGRGTREQGRGRAGREKEKKRMEGKKWKQSVCK